MANFRLTEPAQADLLELADYLAEHNTEAGAQVLTALERGMNELAEMPGMGHMREDLTDEPSLRFWTVRGYLIVYRTESHPLEVMRILHGRRDASRELGSD